MCGITGIWSYNQPDISDREMDIFTDTLAHRGPDGRGTYHNTENNVRLGHRRLAIVDLSDSGHQPMSYADGKYWIVYNGEIYNFPELREELAGLGYSFTSASDTEVLLASYTQWGEECQLKFNGMWAFAIWDNTARTLFLSRDRFGIKPLFYMVNDRFFSFASEMKAFLALRCYNYGFDQGNIIKALHNIDGLEGTEGCLLQGVKRLMGGHCLILGSNGIPVIKRWWYTLDHLVQVPDTFEKQVEQFRELFFDACRIRMRSDVSIGTSLSGGLDSSSVLAAIHKIGQVEGFTTDWQKAFVICYPGTNLDERQYARIMIESTRASPVYTVVEYDVFSEHIRDMIYQSEEIFWVLWEGPWLNYKVMRENRVFVSMDGHGADELFGGYAPIVDEEKKFALQHGKLLYYLTLRKTLKNLKEGSALVNLSIIGDALYFLTSNGMSAGRKLLKKSLKDKKQTILRDNPVLERKRSNESHLNNLLYDYFHTYKLPTILRGFDRMSMAHGVEIRMPFMDWRLVTYAFSLPDNGKISHGYTKYILRASMDLIIPESVRLRTNKIGFSSPMAQWFESGLGNLILPVITDLTRQYPQFYPPGNLVEDMEQCIAQKKWDLLTSLWPTIQIYLLIDVFNKKRESLLLL